MYLAKVRKQMEEQDMKEVQSKVDKRLETGRSGSQQVKRGGIGLGDMAIAIRRGSSSARDDFQPEELPDGAFVSPKHTPTQMRPEEMTILRPAEYIGSFSVCGVDEDTRALQVETQLQSLQTVQQGRPVELEINLEGVKVFNSEDQAVLMYHELKRISYAACDPQHHQFSFLAREKHLNIQYCHTFRTSAPEQAEELNVIMGDAFKMAYANQRDTLPTFHELIEAQIVQQQARFREIERQAHVELQRKLAEIARPTPFSQHAIQRMEQRKVPAEESEHDLCLGKNKLWTFPRRCHSVRNIPYMLEHTCLADTWVFSCFRNPPNADMDYGIFNAKHAVDQVQHRVSNYNSDMDEPMPASSAYRPSNPAIFRPALMGRREAIGQQSINLLAAGLNLPSSTSSDSTDNSKSSNQNCSAVDSRVIVAHNSSLTGDGSFLAANNNSSPHGEERMVDVTTSETTSPTTRKEVCERVSTPPQSAVKCSVSSESVSTPHGDDTTDHDVRSKSVSMPRAKSATNRDVRSKSVSMPRAGSATNRHYVRSNSVSTPRSDSARKREDRSKVSPARMVKAVLEKCFVRSSSDSAIREGSSSVDVDRVLRADLHRGLQAGASSDGGGRSQPPGSASSTPPAPPPHPLPGQQHQQQRQSH